MNTHNYLIRVKDEHWEDIQRVKMNLKQKINLLEKRKEERDSIEQKPRWNKLYWIIVLQIPLSTKE